MSRDLIALLGFHVVIVALAEACRTYDAVTAITLTASVVAWIRHAHVRSYTNAKCLLIYAVVISYSLRKRVGDAGGRVYLLLTAANVWVMVVPSLYNKHWLMALSVALLGLTTPSTLDAIEAMPWARAYAVVFFTYLAMESPFRGGPLRSVFSVTPMLAGLLTHNVDRTIMCRHIGMLVMMVVCELPVVPFGRSTRLPLSLFRPTKCGRPLMTSVSDAFAAATDPVTHPTRYALAMGLNALALTPVLAGMIKRKTNK